jgi:hypothetical protein
LSLIFNFLTFRKPLFDNIPEDVVKVIINLYLLNNNSVPTNQPRTTAPRLEFFKNYQVLSVVCKMWFKVIPLCVEVINTHAQAKLLKDEFASKCIYLTTLCLYNNVSVTDHTIKKLIYLTSLNLQSNYTITIDGIRELTQLTHLNLQENIMITDEGISGLTNLKSLVLSHNHTISNSGIANLTGLTALDLSCNNIFGAEITCDTIMKLTNLQVLELVNHSGITRNDVKENLNFIKKVVGK